jgi:general secretion pathway protein D
MTRLSAALVSLALLVGAVAFVSPGLPQAQPAEDPAIVGADGTLTLDFDDVEIRDLVRYIAEATGRNFIVDPRVSGKVTLISPSPVAPEAALDMLESLLATSGFAIVPAGDAEQVIPVAEASKSPVEVAPTNARPGQVVTQVAQLEHVSIASIIPIVKPLLSKDAVLTGYAPTNSLILTENFSNMKRLLSVVRQLDTASSAGAIELIPLSHADAGQVASVLRSIYSQNAANGAEGARKVQIIPEVGGNNLIVVADLAEMRDIRRLVDQMDTESDSNVKAIEIVYLRNANAEDLAKVLNSVLDKTETAKEDTTAAAASDANTNATLKPLEAFKSKVSVVADESTNALVLSAEPADMVVLKDVIQKLDIRRLQVYVEALIMEVSSEMSDQFGIEWRSASNFSRNSGIVPFGGTSFGNNITNLSQNPLNLPTGFAFGLAGGNITFRGQEFANIGLLVNALKADTNVNILSTPQILTLDNQQAEIIVGDNVPFVTGTYSSNANGGDNPFQTIERKDIGLTLRMTPQISENGFIRMEIYQEISSVAQNTIQATDLVTRKRSIKTSVVVPNQQMIVLGGLIRDDITENNQSIPCLAGLAGAGELFKNTRVQNNKTNLMVFIKPQIINAYDDIETVTQRKYTQIRGFQTETRREGSKLVRRIIQGESDIVPDNIKNGGARTTITPPPAPVAAPTPIAPPTPQAPVQPAADKAVELQPADLAPAPVPDLDLKRPAPKPAEPKPLSLKKPEPAAPPSAPLSLKRPPKPDPVVAAPAPVAKTTPAPEDLPAVDIEPTVAKVATPDISTPEADLPAAAPADALPQPAFDAGASLPAPVAAISFPTDSVTMDAFYRDHIDRVATQLKESPRLKVEVRGYAAPGSGVEGRKRALARSVAVQNYLVSAGIPESQIETYATTSDDPSTSSVNRVDVLRVR